MLLYQIAGGEINCNKISDDSVEDASEQKIFLPLLS